MFGFFTRKRQDEVQRFLNRRMNRSFLPKVDSGNRRHSRGEFCEVAWVLAYDEEKCAPDFEDVHVVVTRDISSDGLSILQTSPINEVRVVVALEGDLETRFILCSVTHSSPLGYGFFQIGLYPEEFLHVDGDVVEEIRQNLQKNPQGMQQMSAQAR